MRHFAGDESRSHAVAWSSLATRICRHLATNAPNDSTAKESGSILDPRNRSEMPDLAQVFLPNSRHPGSRDGITLRSSFQNRLDSMAEKFRTRKGRSMVRATGCRAFSGCGAAPSLSPEGCSAGGAGVGDGDRSNSDVNRIHRFSRKEFFDLHSSRRQTLLLAEAQERLQRFSIGLYPVGPEIIPHQRSNLFGVRARPR